MPAFFISALGFIAWAFTIITIYYSKFYSGIDHAESPISGYAGYLFTVGILYVGYKIVSYTLGWKKLKFSFWSILGITLLHICILSFVYSGLPEIAQSPFMQGVGGNGFTLFFHICSLLIYPIFLVFMTRGIGFSLAELILPTWRNIDIRLRVPAEITLGFVLFVVGLLIVGSMGYYTYAGLMSVLIVLTLIGYRGHRETYTDIRDRYIEIENHDMDKGLKEGLNLKLLSIEFGFFFLTFLLSVSLINVIRPMPIGWDDLGVYMNFPKIMASSGHLLQGAGMYAWQLITGTGFLFSYNASQAFYVNQLGGILAVIAIISTLSYAFEIPGKKTLLSLPILFGLVYYGIPMTVFQQAKDMKLDPAYLFFCISGVMLLFHAWKTGKEITKRSEYCIIAIIGLIVGFTFTVKFTSLMVILGGLGVIAYRLLSFSGYVGYFFIFLAVFTKLQLWGMMNVPMPKDNLSLINSISLFLGVIGIVCIGISFFSKKTPKEQEDGLSEVKDNRISIMHTWLVSSLVFLVSVGVGVSPWLIKNAGEIGMQGFRANPINVLNGSGGTTNYAFESLYTEAELKEKREKSSQSMTTEGTSQNEDLGRYFGYEEGLNNYLKLPANLTFQKNQSGEFTDISYIFLALLPGLLLFIQGKRRYTLLAWGGLLLVLMIFYYFCNRLDSSVLASKSIALSKILANFTLIIEPGKWQSYGYAVLLALNFLILAFFHFALKDTEENRRLREVIMFMGIYAFLFMIAAFGIVWYGIVMYFGFFLIMGYSALTFTSEDIVSSKKETEEDFGKIFLSAILFIFISVYFIRTAFPHGWSNLRGAYYNEYKYNTLSQEESIFAYRSDYLVPIATMNLKDPTKIFDGIEKKMQSKQMLEFLAKTDIKTLPLDVLHGSFIMKYRNASDIAFRNDVRTLGQILYSNVLYPPKENTNTGGIYRIGTFMTYLIQDNRKRYFDDSLVMTFGDYFYDPSPEKTIDRMKSLGLKYLLVDLNAATIDRDPRHALTDRAEKLLLTMNAPNLKLVKTDNFCLELAISERKKGKLQTDNEFIDIAGTNSESYRDGVQINRNQKLGNCHAYIIKIINEKRSSEYPLIQAIEQAIQSEGAAQESRKLQSILLRYVGQSWFALFEIIDTPPPAKIVTLPTPVAGSGSSLSGSTQVK